MNRFQTIAVGRLAGDIGGGDYRHNGHVCSNSIHVCLPLEFGIIQGPLQLSCVFTYPNMSTVLVVRGAFYLATYAGGRCLVGIYSTRQLLRGIISVERQLIAMVNR